MIKRIFTSSIFFLILAFVFSTVARAEEIVLSISGNGSSSNNTVEANVSTTTTVEQSNEAQITNNVDANADTGNNNASSNTGDANIQTGSIDSTTNINNQNINQNTAVVDGCGCGSGVNVKIDGNGVNSANSINLNISNIANVNQQNSANITNNVNVSANTGRNDTNFNNGDITIKTGNIATLIDILNKNINQNFDSHLVGSSGVSVSVSGNGDYSINQISLLFNSIFNYETRNIAEIINNVIVDANTGENIANKNNGSVLIATGDIVSVVNIGNENINSSLVSVDCNCSPTPPGGDGETPPVGGNPGTTPSSSGGGGGGGNGSSVGGAGQVLGAAIGAVLPATGGYLMLLMTLLAIIMFAAGWYLRFGSDPSPPSYAFA
ncbi:MAG: hypothetical protein HYT08_01065 [Candidatus Levybacteria bacterium]|nr:hypothetical protein [Candidatus Levybacteria bacterium]